MTLRRAARRLAAPVLLTAAAVLIAPAMALAHPRVSPAVSLSGELQLYSLAVPTEKAGVTTTSVELTVPRGFSIDSFAPAPPGWTRRVRQSGSADSAVVQRVTWSGGHTPSGEDAVFSFLAEPASPGTYRFTVQQTYSDGSIVNWTGSEASQAPAPSIRAEASLGGGGGGGGTSTLTLVALIVGVLGLAAGALALVDRRGGGGPRRPLA